MATDAEKAVPKNNALTFDSTSLVSPIRFDPDPADQPTNASLGSGSTLSSSMTPESSTSNPGGSLLVNNEPAPRTKIRLSMSQSSPRLPMIHAPRSSTLGSHDDQLIWTEAARATPGGSGLYQAPGDGKKILGKLTTQYFLPDGSMITGKGLGRGRPGVKRGPRKAKLSGEDSTESTPSAPAQMPDPSATPSGTKRKRVGSEPSNIRARSVSSSAFSRESSVEYNPTATHTRFGRQTVKPTPITAPDVTPSATTSPVTKKVSTPVASTPTLKTHPKIKRKIYRGKEQFALCEHCLRGFGPVDNAIVFCDACNKCWHQRCHTPQIPKEIIADTKAEWFCATCDRILHGNKKSKKQPVSKAGVLPPPQPLPVAAPLQQRFGPPLIGAIALTLEQRKKYLESLSRDHLINLLLRAGELAPQMPIFETPIPLPRVGPHLQPQFTSDYVTPVTHSIPGLEKATSSVDGVADEGYDDTYDEHAALYPKVGEGVTLPPERQDLNMLLEGPESRTFSHWVKGLPVKTVVDTVPLHQSQFQYSK